MKIDVKNCRTGRIGRPNVGAGTMAGLAALLAMALALTLTACDRDQGQFDEQDISDNNRGVALMGSFDYSLAQETFGKLVDRRPEWLDARINLAISTLNRQQEGDEQSALKLVNQVLADDPENLRALYVSGLLYLYQGESAQSLESLRKVAGADPGDAYAAYFIAQNLMQTGELEEALTWYRKSFAADGYLRSAYYGAALALRRLNRREEARSMLADYERLKDNPRARLAEFKYTRMGPKAEALAQGYSESETLALPGGPVFDEPRDLKLAASAHRGGHLTIADADGDGVLDLYVASPSGSLLMIGDGGGDFVANPDHPLSKIPGIAAAAWGDIDNDGRTDVYLCRHGENQLWMRQSDVGWSDSAAQLGVDDAGKCADVGVLDADHDGDLDVFVVNGDGPDELFNNNRDGSFRRLGEQQGIAGSGRGRQFIAADLDNDRDVDFIIVNDGGPNELWINDRMWSYYPAAGAGEFRAASIMAATAGDLDADGQIELYSISPDGLIMAWRLSDERKWTPGRLTQLTVEKTAGLSIADVDGDGVQELVASADESIHIVRQGKPTEIITWVDGRQSPAQTINLDPVKGPSLVALSADGALIRQWPPGPGRHDFLSLEMSGKEDEAESMRSNRSGIGTRVALRNLDRWTVAWTFDSHSGPGQSLQPLSIGLGGRHQADFVAIDWSDGVFQTELDLTAGEVHRITETQRQLSSCPVLFAWDGHEFRFVSDLLGVGGLGFFVRPGQYSTPRPWEFFLLPEQLSVQRDGRYAIKITEPMEENAYLDSMRLHVIDLPPSWSVVPDERMATGLPDVTGRQVFFRQELLPESAINDRGDDVTELILSEDQHAAPVGHLDKRFVGRLEDVHELTIEFGQVINPAGVDPVLVAEGWVEYPYSQTVFAAWQASETYQPTSLEARSTNGVWTMVYPGFGYPAGMPRTMVLPLGKLPSDTNALRLSTNLEVYWDRLRIVYEETPPDVHREVSSPVHARLTKTGFPLRTTADQRRPDYNYEIRQAFWDARYLDGEYTRLGPVDELLADSDDAIVIMGSGEEVHIEFQAPPDAPPAGWTRRLILEARGWAKDMDMYTRDGGQVGPLPRSGSSGPDDEKRRARLHDLYNTRFQGGR